MTRPNKYANPIIMISKTLQIMTFFVFAGTASVWATGTPRGTVISSQATAAFTVVDSTRRVNSNIIALTIAQLAAVNWTPPTASQAAGLNTPADYPAAITNSGNWEDQFDITAVSSRGFPAAVYLDSNADGVLSPAELAAGPLTRTATILADSAVYVVARVIIANNPALIGQLDVLTATATSVYDPTKNASGVYTTSISSAALLVTKTVSAPGPYAGDRVTYTIVYTNSGTAAASNVTVTDVFDNNLVFVTGSATPSPVSVAGQTVTWDLGAVPPTTGTIRFDVDIVNTVVPGTEIHNVADVRYFDGPNLVQLGSTETNFITIQSPTVTVDFTPDRLGAGEPGDTIDYAYAITNNGSVAETFDVSYTSSQGLSWLIYHDANGNDRIDAGEPVTATTGSLPSGMTYPIVARSVLPRVSIDGMVDSTIFMVSSTTNPDNFRTRRGTTTIVIPVMSLQKFADAPDPRPGNEIRYIVTYTNTGSGQAYAFTVADSIPGNTVYVPESVRLNSVNKTDAADTDEVIVQNGVIAVRVGTVAPAASGIIEFRVRITL